MKTTLYICLLASLLFSNILTEEEGELVPGKDTNTTLLFQFDDEEEDFLSDSVQSSSVSDYQLPKLLPLVYTIGFYYPASLFGDEVESPLIDFGLFDMGRLSASISVEYALKERLYLGGVFEFERYNQRYNDYGGESKRMKKFLLRLSTYRGKNRSYIAPYLETGFARSRESIYQTPDMQFSALNIDRIEEQLHAGPVNHMVVGGGTTIYAPIFEKWGVGWNFKAHYLHRFPDESMTLFGDISKGALRFGFGIQFLGMQKR